MPQKHGGLTRVLVAERTEVLTARDAERWNQVLSEIGLYDTYHTPAFHRLAEIGAEGTAAMLVHRTSSCTIAFPMLLRDIDLSPSPGIAAGQKDATSVYGYPGPVASRKEISPEVKEQFAHVLQEFLGSQGVICAFSRLNPVLENAHILRGCGEIVDIGATVSIDLALPRDVQYARYRRSHKQDIQQLKEMGFSCVEEDEESLDEFVRIYHETMDRNGAEDYYYFGRAYFQFLLDNLPGNSHLFICRESKGVAVSGMIVLACNGVVHGHLGGTLNDYVKLAPMKLAYDAVRVWANSIGAQTFHLGGGIGGRDDSLLLYKKGFGKQEHAFSIWRHYVDPDACESIYREMCRLTGVVPEEFYFPPYRHPEFASIQT